MGQVNNKGTGVQPHRFTLRLSETDFQKLQYWADKQDCSINSFIIVLLDLWIDIQNGNYQLPTLEIYRLNQLIEAIQVLSQNQKNLESIITNGFDSLLSLTRGDNYLLEQLDDDV